MQHIRHFTFPISEVVTKLKEIWSTKSQVIEEAIERESREFFSDFRTDLYVYAELPYIDKVYRDSFYHYFSTKHAIYERDCIRLSFFKEKIGLDDFRNADIKDLNKRFMGTVVLRPMSPLFGRSLLSPKILTDDKNKFVCCLVNTVVSVNGLKFELDAFPHSSQDGETITCAETTIWAIMEYFGNKYPDYQTVLPSKIISVLSEMSTERQIPSRGLTTEQISYALKEFDFGVRVYSKKDYGNKEFKRMLYYYVESGIPVVATMSNGEEGHAMVIIGHEEINKRSVYRGISYEIHKSDGETIKIRDTADIRKRYVFIDDNCPPYKLATLDKPTQHYSDSDYRDAVIYAFIVPLHPKIYLEAEYAREYVFGVLAEVPVSMGFEKELVMRMFLTSSRSFKQKVASDTTIDEKIKNLIILTSMPKFCWIAEFTSAKLYNKRPSECVGFMAIDATSSNTNDAILFVFYPNWLITYNKEGVFEDPLPIQLNPVKMYTNNLKNVNK